MMNVTMGAFYGSQGFPLDIKKLLEIFTKNFCIIKSFYFTIKMLYAIDPI